MNGMIGLIGYRYNIKKQQRFIHTYYKIVFALNPSERKLHNIPNKKLN
jgi:hypothetical protein